jgi:hypothetical protein
VVRRRKASKGIRVWRGAAERRQPEAGQPGGGSPETGGRYRGWPRVGVVESGTAGMDRENQKAAKGSIREVFDWDHP